MGLAGASVEAVIAMRVADYYTFADRHWLRLNQNGAERHVLVDSRLEPYIDAYLAIAGVVDEPLSPLFRLTVSGRHDRITARQITRQHVLSLIKDNGRHWS
jgi:hypothetical protein